MSKESAVIVLGVLVIIIPQLGVPSPWRTTMLVFSGLALIILGLYLRAERTPRTPRGSQSYVENLPAQAGAPEHTESHDRKEGINSFN